MKKTRILITGASGLTGKAVNRIFSNDDDFVIDIISRRQNLHFEENIHIFDLRDLKELRHYLMKYNPMLIIHCAAMANADQCEIYREDAYLTNVLVTNELIDYCSYSLAKLCFLSSDYIFDGRNGPYSEMEDYNPINYYGVTKVISEEKIRTKLTNYLIIRTTVIYGYEESVRENFLHWVLNQILDKGKVKVVDGQFGNPTYNVDLAFMIYKLLKNNKSGIYNAAGASWISRYELATTITEVFGYEKEHVIRIPMSSLKQTAKRPLYGGFNLDKIIKELNYTPFEAYKGLELINERIKYGEIR